MFISECELILKKTREELVSTRTRSQEVNSEYRRLKSEFDAARDSAAERESSAVVKENTVKMEMAKEKALITGQLDAANKKIKGSKTRE